MATPTSRTAEHGPITIQGQFSKHKSSRKVNAWCALFAGGIIGPYLVENYAGNQVVVNSECYCAMVNNFVMPILEEYDIDANNHSNNGLAARGVSWMYIFPQQ